MGIDVNLLREAWKHPEARKVLIKGVIVPLSTFLVTLIPVGLVLYPKIGHFTILLLLGIVLALCLGIYTGMRKGA